MTQDRTRSNLDGPFFRDWGEAVKATKGWGDGDNWFLNYVGHPMQGTMSGYIQIQNDPIGRTAEFGSSREYWISRMKATGWATAYSVQFEIGPISESSIGNVGMRKGTSGYVDHVITPVGGFGLMVAEDALDRYVIRKLEARTLNVHWRGFFRIALNPSRAFVNMMRGKGPWYRDTRPISPPPLLTIPLGSGN